MSVLLPRSLCTKSGNCRVFGRAPPSQCLSSIHTPLIWCFLIQLQGCRQPFLPRSFNTDHLVPFYTLNRARQCALKSNILCVVWEIWGWHLRGFFVSLASFCHDLPTPFGSPGLSSYPVSIATLLFVCGMVRMNPAAQWHWLWTWSGQPPTQACRSKVFHQTRVVVASPAYKGANWFFFFFPRLLFWIHKVFSGISFCCFKCSFFLLLSHLRPCGPQVPGLLITPIAGTWQQVAAVLLIMSPGLGILL